MEDLMNIHHIVERQKVLQAEAEHKRLVQSARPQSLSGSLRQTISKQLSNAGAKWLKRG